MSGWMETAAPSRFLAQPASYKANRFRLADLDLTQKPSADEFWFPEHATPWYYLPHYADLSPASRKRYTQLYALGANEAFIALEREFINAILRDRVQDLSVSPFLSEHLVHFINEEEKHAQMFEAVNRAAAPEMYRHSPFYLTAQRHFSPVFWFRLIGRFHRQLSFWPWVMIFFEERSLMYSKEFIKARNQGVATLFTECHRLHMLEEIQHVQLDEMIIEEFYARSSPASRWLAGRMLENLVRSYAYPRRLSLVIADILIAERPHERAVIGACLAELPSLGTNRAFRRQSFGPDATRRFRRLLARFPEMAGVEKIIAL